MLSFIASPLAKIGMVAILIFAAVAYRAVLIHERDSARAEAAKAEAALTQCHANEQTYQQAIANQNAKIAAQAEQAHQDVLAAEARATLAENDAQAIVARANLTASSLIRAPIADGCPAAIAWGNAQAPALARW
jgi:hypothetical protein